MGRKERKGRKTSIILKMLSIKLLAPKEIWFSMGSSNIPAERGSEIVQPSLYNEDPRARKGRWLAQCSRVVMSELGLEFRPPRSQCSPFPCHFRPPFLQAPRPSPAHIHVHAVLPKISPPVQKWHAKALVVPPASSFLSQAPPGGFLPKEVP